MKRKLKNQDTKLEYLCYTMIAPGLPDPQPNPTGVNFSNFNRKS